MTRTRPVQLAVEGFDEVWRVPCGETVAFVALHAVLGGHAFGGIRIRRYPDEASALADARALARAMTRKVLLAGIAGGGGKSVMLEPPPGADRAACVRALGAFVDSLGGRYQCGPDLGFTDADDAALRAATRHVACAGLAAATARGVEIAMRAVVPELRRVTIQGLGAVGAPLARSLVDAGVAVVASDVADAGSAGLASGAGVVGGSGGSGGFDAVEVARIYDVEADVFAPCAVGGLIDVDVAERLRVRVVCGGANNPLADERAARRLMERGIVYVPDVVSNAGATIAGASAVLGEKDKVEERLAAIATTTRAIVDEARASGRLPHQVAYAWADRRLAELRAG